MCHLDTEHFQSNSDREIYDKQMYSRPRNYRVERSTMGAYLAVIM